MILLKDILKDALKSVQLGQAADLAALEAEWKTIMGSPLDGVTRPAYLKDKILLIEVSDPAFMEPLEYSKRQIVEKVRALTGRNAVRAVTFRLSLKENKQ